MKDFITDLHKQYSNRMLTVRDATNLLILNTMYNYGTEYMYGTVKALEVVVSHDEIPNLMYHPMYKQWYHRIASITCGRIVDPKKLVELFKQYLPSAPADTPLLKYFGKSTTTTTTTTVQYEGKLQIQHIKPNLRTLGQYVFECTNGKEADKEGFLIETAYSGLLADYLWQELQHIISITADTSITIGNLKKVYTMNDNTATWIRMVVDFMKVCYNTKKKLSATDFCNLIQGLDSNNTRNEKESTFYGALPSELKLRVMK